MSAEDQIAGQPRMPTPADSGHERPLAQAGPGGERSARAMRMSSIQVVEFLLGTEHFAVDLFDVREVVEYTRITALPNTPDYIRGIIDLRGEITTIIDLKRHLHIRSKDSTDENTSRIIVLDDKVTHAKVGIMVDDVLSVSTFTSDQVDDTISFGGDEMNFIIGIIKKRTRIKEKDTTVLIIWIDIRSLLGELHLGDYSQKQPSP